MPLKLLSRKLTLLLALARPSRSTDLSQLDLCRRTYKPDGACFYPNAYAKQSKQGCQIAKFFPSLPGNPLLYPVTTLRTYEERTKPIRGIQTRLLISTIKPYKAVSSSSVARWLKIPAGSSWSRQYSLHILSEEHHPLQLQMWVLPLMRF